MVGSLHRSALAASFGLAAEPCRDALSSYIESEQPGGHFERHTRLALAVLDRCSVRADLDDAGVRNVREVLSDAAAVCRTGRPDDGVVAVAACFEGIVSGCDAALANVERVDDVVPWRRFFFADADIDVARIGRRWRVRTQPGGTAEAASLDVALGDVLALSNHRLGAMTVQVLGWCEHDDRSA